MSTSRRNFVRNTAFAAGAAAIGASPTGATEPSPHSSALNAVKQPTSNFRDHLQRCLGGAWPDPCDLAPRMLRSEQKAGYTLQWIDYAVEPQDRVPAIVLVPDGVSAQSPAPAVAVWHQHNGEWHFGKSEPAGLVGNPMHHTGVALAQLGYVVICPDALCFEDRQDPEHKLKNGDFERFEFLRYTLQGKCMAWKNILDMRRAIDYLTSRPDVRPDRLGCYGHSMGSTHTWLVGPWEPRLRCLIGNCCLPTYAAIERTKILHCFPNFIPGLQAYGDTPDIAALIAPRALHLNLGALDEGSPIAEARRGIDTIAQAYQNCQASDQFTWSIEEGTGHVLSPTMWQHVKATFERHLGSA